MAVTIEQVRDALEPEEVNYRAAAQLGPEALPHLAELARGPDMMLASKAIYLASLIEGGQAEQILEEAAGNPEPVLRVAAATGLKNVKTENAAGRIADRLIADRDLGVRKLTVLSVAALPMPALRQRMRSAVERDPEQVIRELGVRTLRQ
jgi:hypothetical protein